MFVRQVSRSALALSVLLATACAAPAPVSSPSTGVTSASTGPSGSAAPVAVASASASPGGTASARPTSPPGIANADRPLTAGELADVLVAVQATADSATVVADVTLTPVHEACEAPSPCPFGTIAVPGLDAVPVIADKNVRALYPNATRPIAGPLALQLGVDVAWLGAVRPFSGKLAWPVGGSAIPGPDAGGLGTVYAVSGWLDEAQFPCETPPAPPPDSLYESCGGNYVMQGATDDARGTPAGAIQVQPSAYDNFRPDSGGQASTARLGTYLVRQVKDPRPVCGPVGCYGWLMVGRLDPIQ
jgi:hypothetical protein